MFDEHWIFFLYTLLNTLSRVVARQVSVRLEHRMYGGQKPVCGEVMADENGGEDEDGGDDEEERGEG